MMVAGIAENGLRARDRARRQAEGHATQARCSETDATAQRCICSIADRRSGHERRSALVGARRHHAPDRPRPAGVASRRAMTWTCSCGTTLPSAAMLSLSHSVTALQRPRDQRDLAHQLRLLELVEVDDFGDVRPARHQEQPGIVASFIDQHARQRQSRRAGIVSRVELRMRATRLGAWRLRIRREA